MARGKCQPAWLSCTSIVVTCWCSLQELQIRSLKEANKKRQTIAQRHPMSSLKPTGPTFPPTIPGHVIFSGICKGPSQSLFKKESDRFLVLQIHKETRAVEVHEWKSSKEPLPTEPPFCIFQLTPGVSNVTKVVNTLLVVVQ